MGRHLGTNFIRDHTKSYCFKDKVDSRIIYVRSIKSRNSHRAIGHALYARLQEI